jgi:uncharacterized membrane protein YwzB
MKDRYSIGAIIVLGIAFLLVFLLVICSICFHNFLDKPEVIATDLFLIIVIILVFIIVSVFIYLARNMFLIAK